MHPGLRFLWTQLIISMTVSGSLASCKVAGKRPSLNGSAGLAATAGEACDEKALAALIERLGVIGALQADESECLESNKTAIVEMDVASPVESLAFVDQVNEPSEDSSFQLAEDPQHKLRLRILIGWRVINDLLNNVAQDAVNGTSSAGHSAADVGRFREQITRGFDAMRPVFKHLKATGQVDVVYSYSDLYVTVKNNFIDPLVYGYSGPLHRISHRRYSRGRGLVYRIASEKLAEGLAKFHQVGQKELAGFSDATLGVNLSRLNDSLYTSEESFLTLFHNQRVVGQPLSYSRALELAETAKRELPKLMNSPEAQSFANNARPAVQGAAEALGVDMNDPNACQCRSDGQSCSLFKGGQRIFHIPGHQSCNANGFNHCDTLTSAAGNRCSRVVRL